MPTIYLGLGSNLGSRETNLQKAIELLRESEIDVLLTSSVLETNPLGGLDQPKYLNMVIRAETDLEPPALLKACQRIENLLGRVRGEKWASRTIDIDILFYGDLKIATDTLTIPHLGIMQRDFVQQGLKELGKLV